jgi:hypothetical protein
MIRRINVDQIKVIAELLEHACPSIKYRIRLEIFKQSPSTSEMLNLQRQIMEDRVVKDVISWQQPDGWLAWNFHGHKSMESGIRVLCEKGVANNQKVMTEALQALEERTDHLDRGLGKVGSILDERGLGGSFMIRAAVFAYAGIEDKPFIQEQIELALVAFKAVLAIRSISELTEIYHEKLILKNGLLWPSIYHLRLLAWTHSWRTLENKEIMRASIQRLVEFSPIPSFYVRNQSQLIAPASFCMDHFHPEMNTLDDVRWMLWFHRMELLARLGVVEQIPELKEQTSILNHLLEPGGGMFTAKLEHIYFRKWAAYPGLMLETDWKNPRRRIYDLTFRCLLINHYSDSTI